MKKILLTLVLAAFASAVQAQAPQSFKYQAVVRDAGNLILNNQNVGMQLTILQGSANGTAVYTETFATTTNAYGLVNLEIGTGTTTDDFSTIDWANGPFFMETAVDVNGGTSYAVMGTSQLLSVPYALHAETAETVLNDQVNDADADSTNEYNTSVVLNGTDLEVTDGGGTIVTDLSGLSGAGSWIVSGNDIYNGNSGNIGIGFQTPLHTVAVTNGTNPSISVGSTSFNNTSSGAFVFSEDVDSGSGDCGFKFDHNGAANTLDLISGCFIPTAGDTVFRVHRPGYMDIPALMVGDLNTQPAYPLDVMGSSRIDGDLVVTGNVNITGNISKGSGTFKIDHPLDPANKYLVHSFVESPEMMNIYTGNITTDADGYATVDLPSYFEAANKDFRYQLTVIGTFAQAIVKEKIADNKFVIQTNEPNVEVSWSVTGVRADKYANEHRIEPEMEKELKGTYLHPELYGQGVENSENVRKAQQALELKETKTAADGQ